MSKFSKFLANDFFLTKGNFNEAFNLIANGKVTDQEIADFLLQINKFGITKDLLYQAAKVFRSRMIKILNHSDAIDVCGTGGDDLNSLNISTAVCFVVAASGVKVVKHGNKSVSSKSGSADIFQKLGISLEFNPNKIEQDLERHNLAFLFAPNHHPSFRHVANVRKSLKIKTIFNYLGPLLNPAETKSQIIGVSDKKIAKFMPQVFTALGGENCFSVVGDDGMDEISISGNSVINRISQKNQNLLLDSETEEIIFNPEKYGFRKQPISQIQGGDPDYNSKKLLELFAGEKSAYFDIVVLNSALALLLAKKVINIEDGITLAKEAIEAKKALKLIKAYAQH